MVTIIARLRSPHKGELLEGILCGIPSNGGWVWGIELVPRRRVEALCA